MPVSEFVFGWRRPPRRLVGSRVLVTGASGGLGRELCLQCAARGAVVVGLDRERKSLTALGSEMRALGFPLETQACDLTDAAATKRVMMQLQKGGLDVVILNAGVTHIAPLAGTRPQDFRRVLDVNLLGAVHVLQPIVEHLVARKSAVVGIASVAGFAPLLYRTAYVASKHALAGFLETLRAELEDVDVTVVYPAYIRTPLRGRTQAVEVRTPSELSAEKAASIIMRAIERRERRTYLPARARLARLIWNLFPDVYIRLMLREAGPGA